LGLRAVLETYQRQLDHIREDIVSGATSIPAVITELKLRGYVVSTAVEAKRERENLALLERKVCSKAGTCSIKDQTALFRL